MFVHEYLLYVVYLAVDDAPVASVVVPFLFLLNDAGVLLPVVDEHSLQVVVVVVYADVLVLLLNARALVCVRRMDRLQLVVLLRESNDFRHNM